MIIFRKSKYSSLDEFYDAIDNLILQLKDSGFEKDSDKLNTLMRSTWTTASELIGELSLTLKDMKTNYSKEIDQEIGDCKYFAINYRNILKIN